MTTGGYRLGIKDLTNLLFGRTSVDDLLALPVKRKDKLGFSKRQIKMFHRSFEPSPQQQQDAVRNDERSATKAKAQKAPFESDM